MATIQSIFRVACNTNTENTCHYNYVTAGNTKKFSSTKTKLFNISSKEKCIVSISRKRESVWFSEIIAFVRGLKKFT